MKTVKKLISILLAVILLLSANAMILGNAASVEKYPIVYVVGMTGNMLSADGKVLRDGNGVPLPDGYIEEMVKACLPEFIKAITLGAWDSYDKTFIEYWSRIYEGLAFDGSGDVTNGSHTDWSWSYETLKPDNTFGSYLFRNDWRRDPLDNAVLLKDFIDAVLRKTGAEKVDLVGRCEGANIVAAYLAEYDDGKVHAIELYEPAINGIDMVGAVFSSELVFDPEQLGKLYYNKVDLGNSEYAPLLNAVVDYLVESYGFEGACNMLKLIVPKLYKEIMCDALLTSYGSFPGMWALVGKEYYAKARELVFKNKDEKQYAGLIEKIDRYDREVRQCADELLKKAANDGVKIALYVRYGDYAQNVPLCKEMYEYNDMQICVKNSTHGATVAKYGEQLSEKYLSTKVTDYISPDKVIDMSTALFPNTTWVIHNCDHNTFDTYTDELMSEFFKSGGKMTVFSNPDYPQYLEYTGHSLEPMTAATESETTEKALPRFLRAIKNFFQMIKQLFSFLKTLD